MWRLEAVVVDAVGGMLILGWVVEAVVNNTVGGFT